MKIIGFAGMPGSGKSEASKVAREMGLKVVVMGDIIRQEAACLGLEPTDENLGVIGDMLRAQLGPDAVARKTLEMTSGEDVVVVDGLRSKAEVDFFRAKSKEFHLVEIAAPSDSRVKWISARGRSDDPENREGDQKAVFSSIGSNRQSSEVLERRECRELGWGMHEAVREADLRVSNDSDLGEFKKKIEELLRKLGC